MKNLYEKFVALQNIGANDSGFKDAAELWTAGYDMNIEEFKSMIEKTWQQVLPLYEQLHCYVKYRLQEKYGSKVVPLNDGFIPAHLLGNMW